MWDNAASYYMMTTRKLTSDSGTVSALVWQAMQDAAQRQLIFDFGGLTAARSVLFFAAFGGSVSPRYVATKASLPVRVGRELLTLVKTDSDSMW